MISSAEAPHCLVFDSGMGGLTIVQALRAQGFRGRISYAADTGFFPYGDKSDADLTRRIPSVASALFEAVKPDIFVIACNTASTLALEIVRAVLPVPVVGTVPAIKPAAASSQTGVIGVLATPGTLRRAYTAALIEQFARHIIVLTHGSVALVSQAERFAAGEAVSDNEIRDELNSLFGQVGGDRIDTVVLACTHFPLLRARLEQLVPHPVRFIDSGEAIARRTLSLLEGKVFPTQKASEEVLCLTSRNAKTERLEKVARSFGFSTVELINPA